MWKKREKKTEKSQITYFPWIWLFLIRDQIREDDHTHIMLIIFFINSVTHLIKLIVSNNVWLNECRILKLNFSSRVPFKGNSFVC